MLVEAEATSRHFALDEAFGTVLERAFEAGLAITGVIASSEAQRRGLWAVREGIAPLHEFPQHGELPAGEVAERGAVPALLDQQVVRGGERLQARRRMGAEAENAVERCLDLLAPGVPIHIVQIGRAHV